MSVVWSIDPELTSRHRCWLGKLDWREAVVTTDAGMWRAALNEAAQELNRRFPEKSELPQHPCIQAAREAYTAYGVNPKRYPPASEALARRVLGGKSLPAIKPSWSRGSMRWTNASARTSSAPRPRDWAGWSPSTGSHEGRPCVQDGY